SFTNWREQTPDDFVFSVKGGRFITHMKRLLDPQASLANFFASGVLGLGPKLGPILWQLPPDFKYDSGRLTDFFDALPRTHAEAIAVGGGHDQKLTEDRTLLTAEDPEQPIRHALEVRNDTFKTPKLLDLLQEHRIALVIADTAGRWPQIEALTTDFGYLRLHGADELYVSGYTDDGLDAWATKINSWSDRVDDLYVYFDNDAKVRSPYDAMALARRLNSTPQR
ncbi:MAG TPA: DUF72 domain-containing protein, partial [Microlunatus sp.]